MKRAFFGVIAAGLFVCGSAQAQAVTTIKEAGSGALKGDPDRIVCREKTVTGSRLKKSKACRTVREWNDLAAANVAAAKQLGRVGGLDANRVTAAPKQSGPR